MKSIIRDPSLAQKGYQKIEWARIHMDVLNGIAADIRNSHILDGLKIVVSVHLEAKTAYLAQVLHEAGADVYAAGSNPLSTQDDIAAALADSGVTVYAKHGCTNEEYEEYLNMALSCCPDIIIDDGGDLVNILHDKHPEYGCNLIGGCEETTTGIIRLRSKAKAGTLRFPMFNINDADCKHFFDNRYGTGQSAWDGIIRTTNLNIAGRTVVIAGYGWCGKGAAMRAKGLGANVIVTEVNPVRAIEAVMDGFRVMPMNDAAPIGDFFLTVTGDCHVVTPKHMLSMKNGAVLSNAGHFDVEVDVAGLRAIAVSRREIRNNIEAYTLQNGNTVYLIAEGRLVNLAAADGHAIEIMDMSFALQASCVRELAVSGKNMKPGLYPVPECIDKNVAYRKLSSIGISIDTLSDEQYAYLYN